MVYLRVHIPRVIPLRCVYHGLYLSGVLYPPGVPQGVLYPPGVPQGVITRVYTSQCVITRVYTSQGVYMPPSLPL